MTSFRDFAKSVCSELPVATYARWASALFSLSVLTFLRSLAAAQAFLALAALAYVIQVRRNCPAVHFPPIMLPLALFCLFALLSTWKAASPGAGGFAVRKLVLFAVLLFTANLMTSARHFKLLWDGLFLESALTGWCAFFLVGLFEFNFGTAPVLLLFLFVMSTPLLVQRSESGEGEASLLAASLPLSV